MKVYCFFVLVKYIFSNPPPFFYSSPHTNVWDTILVSLPFQRWGSVAPVKSLSGSSWMCGSLWHLSVFIPARHSPALPGKRLQTVRWLGVCLDYVTWCEQSCLWQAVPFPRLGPWTEEEWKQWAEPWLTWARSLPALDCGCDQPLPVPDYPVVTCWTLIWICELK